MKYPTVREILTILAEAGENGAIPGDIARRFDEPPTLQRRLAAVNVTLRRLGTRVRRADEPERTPYYKHMRTYRWFITPEGLQYLSGPLAKERENARFATAKDRREYAELLQTSKLTVKTLSSADKDCFKVRDELVRQFFETGLMKADIARLVGLSRERVRQIIEGILPRTCHCKPCIALYREQLLEV